MTDRPKPIAYNYVPTWRCQAPSPERSVAVPSCASDTDSSDECGHDFKFKAKPPFQQKDDACIPTGAVAKWSNFQEMRSGGVAVGARTSLIDCDGPPRMSLPYPITEALSLAYDEDAGNEGGNLDISSVQLSGFCMTGLMDAAQAAWIGGTEMLSYGELLPGGVARVLGLLTGGCSRNDGHPDVRQFVLELGMGRGRVALHLFLAGATVIGVEMCRERFDVAVAAMERLAHRQPSRFEIAHRTSQVVRLCQRGGSTGGLFEARLGNFFELVSTEEFGVASLVFLHVRIPLAVRRGVRHLAAKISAGCRIVSYEDLGHCWQPDEIATVRHLCALLLACSWNPTTGHTFHIFERISSDGCLLEK